MTTKPPVKVSAANNPKTVVEHLCSFFKERIKASGTFASGESGFEGLVAKLLAALTGQPYLVASSGLQQKGDALDHTGRISIQCKAYFGKNNPTVVQITGDANTQIHSNHNIEVYVLALRSLSTQIQSLESFFSDHGLDFICIQSTNENPDLLCLLARYWKVVKSHPVLAKMPASLRQSIVALQTDNTDLIPRTLGALKTRIEHASGTYEVSRLHALSFLRKRFNLTSQGPSSFLFPIDLPKALPRFESGGQFRVWWQEKSTPFLFAEGEEGYGKSWLIAQEVWHIAESGQTLVLWLDSNQWSASETLREVVSRAFRYCLGIPDTETDKLDRLYRKLIKRWERPVLLILDGMNEHDGTTAADRIVTDYASMLNSGQQTEVIGNGTNFENIPARLPIRIVFTTRPLALRAQNPSTSAGRYGSNYSVPPFSSK